MKIELQEEINVKDILTSGACFRVTLEEDNSITNILSDRVINIKQEKNILYIKSSFCCFPGWNGQKNLYYIKRYDKMKKIIPGGWKYYGF